jgi:uncharacterized protein YjfI (DUF2170 family)
MLKIKLKNQKLKLRYLPTEIILFKELKEKNNRISTLTEIEYWLNGQKLVQPNSWGIINVKGNTYIIYQVMNQDLALNSGLQDIL